MSAAMIARVARRYARSIGPLVYAVGAVTLLRGIVAVLTRLGG